MTIEQKTSLPPVSEAWKGFYSANGVRVVESAVAVAQRLGHANLNEIHLGLALVEDPIAQDILTTAGMDSQMVKEALKPELERMLTTAPPTDSRSFTAIVNAALAENIKFGKKDGLIGVGNLLEGLYQSSTLAGQALRKVLIPKVKTVSDVLARLRNATNRAEEDQAIW